MIPVPQTNVYELIPPVSIFTYTPPSISLPSPPMYPTPGAPSGIYPPGIYIPVWILNVPITLQLKYDIVTRYFGIPLQAVLEASTDSQDNDASISASLETSTDSNDLNLSLSTSVETEVT